MKIKTQVEKTKSFAEFKDILEKNSIKVVKIIFHGSTLYYKIDGRLAILPATDVILTSYKIGEVEEEDRIYRYMIRFSDSPQYPNVSSKADFRNFKELIKALRNLQSEGYVVRGGEWGRPLEEKPDEYSIEWRERAGGIN